MADTYSEIFANTSVHRPNHDTLLSGAPLYDGSATWTTEPAMVSDLYVAGGPGYPAFDFDCNPTTAYASGLASYEETPPVKTWIEVDTNEHVRMTARSAVSGFGVIFNGDGLLTVHMSADGLTFTTTLASGDKFRQWTQQYEVAPGVIQIGIEIWTQENRISIDDLEEVYDFPLQDSLRYGIVVPAGAGKILIHAPCGDVEEPQTLASNWKCNTFGDPGGSGGSPENREVVCVWYRSDAVCTCQSCNLVPADSTDLQFEDQYALDNSTGWTLHNRKPGANPRAVDICEEGPGARCSPWGNPYDAYVNSQLEPTAASYLEFHRDVLEGAFGWVPAIRQPRIATGVKPPVVRAFTDPASFNIQTGWTVFSVVRLAEPPVGAGSVASGNLECLFGSADGVLALGLASEEGVFRAKAKYGEVELSLRIPKMVGNVLIFTLRFDPLTKQLSLAELYSGSERVTINNPPACSGLQVLRPASNANTAGAYAAEKEFFEYLSSCRALTDEEVGEELEYLQQRYDVPDPPLLGITSSSFDGVREIEPAWAANLQFLSPALTHVRCTIQPREEVNWAQWSSAIQRYTAAPPLGHNLTVFAILPPEFGGAVDRAEWAEGLTGLTNTFITRFAERARTFALTCVNEVQNYIIWNEYNAPDTSFRVPPTDPLNARHFAALLYQVYHQFHNIEPRINANIYWGGIQAPSTGIDEESQTQYFPICLIG
jgi:hypothetical protein